MDKAKKKKTIGLIAFILFGIVILVIIFRNKIMAFLTKSPEKNSLTELTNNLTENNNQLKKELLELVKSQIDSSKTIVNHQNGNTIILKGIGWKRTIAQETITRGYVVRIAENAGIDNSYSYDPMNIDNYGLATGIALHSASVGQECFVQVEGTAEIPDWNLSNNQLMFIGAGGILTTQAPIQGLSQTVGNAISSDELNINFSIPIILNNDDNA